MTDPRQALLALLGDGALHAGPELGKRLGCTRAAVWKQVAALRAMGLPVQTVGGRGYQVPGGIELLDPGRIRQALGDPARQALVGLAVEFTMESTSATLLAARPPGAGQVACCLAEYQSGGRGRRGRRWLSPVAQGLCLSLGARLERGGRELPALSLAAGVAVLRALAACGFDGARLKWPNDVVHGDGKLGGILVDVAGEPGGPLYVVVGVGLNVHAPPPADAIALAGGLCPAGLPAGPDGSRLSRNLLAAALVDALHEALCKFDELGFAPFADAWRLADALAGREVTVDIGGRVQRGIARGIATDGALLVEADGVRRQVLAGEVTLRTQS
jgi:BirA family biotin operon repressor/biotin-[acetyl-CoA-carboxylase] ligase